MAFYRVLSTFTYLAFTTAKAEMEYITTSQGTHVDSNQNSLTAGPKGPIVAGDFHLFDKLAHFNRERIPERVVHAKGAGAFGIFEVLGDITKYSKASVFSSLHKKTKIFTRFSTVGGEKGSADTARDPRGFAIKFFTENGNWDLVGNNTPVFFIRDAIKFPDFLHTQKRNPQSNLHDPDMFWDFLSLVPESNHQVTILFSNRGTPNGYRHMHGYGSHTFKFINEEGEMFYTKFHMKTRQGVKNFTAEEAEKLAAKDPDYATRDLFDAIQNANYPSWDMMVQIIPEAEAEKLDVNILDVTKTISQKLYPLILVGRLTLNRNPGNYFASTEQVGFSPGNLIPGIEPSNDKMLQARIMSYHDAQRHRLGPNYEMIPINTPLNKTNAYHIRDGAMCVNDNKEKHPNYEPNSIKRSPKENPLYAASHFEVSGTVGRHKQNDEDDYSQARELFQNVLTEYEREHLLNNIAGHLRGAKREIQRRQVEIFYRVHPNYGMGVARRLGMPPNEVVSRL